jgi:hypothetical protein
VLKKTIYFLFFLILFFNLKAEQVAHSWDFNTAGDTEDWTKFFGISDIKADSGMLIINTANSFPTIVHNGGIRVNAEENGYIYIRMQANGATEIRVNWQKSDSSVTFITASLPISGDSLFHIYRIPLYAEPEWEGEIINLTKIQLGGPLTFAGETVKIDYIRIVNAGAVPKIVNFSPLRTVLKVGHTIPLMAIIENIGDKTGEMSSSLLLPAGIEVVSGVINNDHTVFPGGLDTVHWEIGSQTTERYTVNFSLWNENDTLSIEKEFVFRDRYWQQEEFLLSAWSPPYAWYGQPYEDSVFTYYKNAHFDNMLWVGDDDALMQKVHEHGLKYFLLITNIIGEEYLRAPDKVAPPDVTEEMLQEMERVVNKYINDPNLLGYHICDEPRKQAFPNIGRVVERLREIDPERLSFVNIWPSSEGYGEYIDNLLQTAKLELLSYDRYHFYNGYDGGSYFYNLEIIRRFALKYDIPFCNIIQAIGTNGTVEEDLNWRTPNEAEHRFLVYSSLAYGVHALIWFHWHGSWGLTGNPDRDIIYPSIQSINSEIDSLKEIMVKLTTTGVYQNKPASGANPLPPDGLINSVSANADIVVGYFKDNADKEFFMLMNKNYNDSVIVNIDFNGIVSGLRYFDVVSSQWYSFYYCDSSGHSEFSTILRPGGAKLFAFDDFTAGIEKDKEFIPHKYNLMQNYPNPFNPSSKIEYEIAEASAVKLIIYDALGRKVKTLVDRRQNPGRYQVNFNAEGLASGVYFYRLISGDFTQTRKMLLLR